jgi:hypothetical protein
MLSAVPRRSAMQFTSLALIAVLLPIPAYADSLQAILADHHTVTFVVVNGILTLYFAVFRFDRFAVAHGPEILTTVGILGCFYGIARALLGFDSDDIAGALPLLLQGVKTAFVSSVSGIGGALLIRLRHKLHRGPIPVSVSAPRVGSVDDVVEELRTLRQDMGAQATQARATREAYEEFTRRVVADRTEALVSALGAVVRDFNVQVNEQFGGHFKELNVAVKDMLIWQDGYRATLEDLMDAQQASSSDLRSSAEALHRVAEDSVAFTTSAKNLEQVVINSAGAHVAIHESISEVHKLLENISRLVPEAGDRFETLSRDLSAGTQSIQATTTRIVNDYGSHSQMLSKSLTEAVARTLLANQQSLNMELERSVETMKDSVKLVEKLAREDLRAVTLNLARDMKGLSEQFVHDFTPVAQRLSEIAKTARAI